MSYPTEKFGGAYCDSSVSTQVPESPVELVPVAKLFRVSQNCPFALLSLPTRTMLLKASSAKPLGRDELPHGATRSSTLAQVRPLSELRRTNQWVYVQFFALVV